MENNNNKRINNDYEELPINLNIEPAVGRGGGECIGGRTAGGETHNGWMEGMERRKRKGFKWMNENCSKRKHTRENNKNELMSE